MNNKNDLVALHLSVLLFGSAGLFAVLLPVNPLLLVFGRLFFGFIGLSAYLLITKQWHNSLSFKSLMTYWPSGAILVFHWFAFFKSIQLLNVSSGLFLFATFPVFSAILEYLFFKEKLSRNFLFCLMLTMVGLLAMNMAILQDTVNFMGIIWGVLSGFSFAILSLMNRHYLKRQTSPVITLNQFLTAGITAFVCLTLESFNFPTGREIAGLAVLGLIFTALSHTLFIRSLKSLSVKTASMVSCLEPVYGSVCAYAFLGEQYSLLHIVGGMLILCAAMLITFRN